MTKVCTSCEMKNIDRMALESGGIPSIVLMENAAIACFEEIVKLESVKNVAVICGKGNNAGDGFAIARHLKNHGIDVKVYLVSGSDFSNDALINFEIISKMGIEIVEIYNTVLFELEIKTFDLIVDAIFGTGIRGEISGLIYDVINVINNSNKYVLSVDIPSGIDADSGRVCGICIKASKTVTFAAYKKGLVLFPGADFCGEIIVKGISIPQYIIENQNINIELIDNEFIRGIMPERRKNSHKGDYGKVLIIGGSEGLSGAVCLAAEACVKSGAGLVTVAVSKDLNPIIETKLTEPMSLALPCVDGHLEKAAAHILTNIVNDFDAVLFGCGIGRSSDIEYILSEILKVCEIPLIIDADGLFILSKNKSMLDRCKCNLILTPHEAEMSRLCDLTIEDIKNNRIEISENYATHNGVTLILKGAHTIVTSPCGKQYININGNCGMATGGSGDVLAGVVTAFVARGINETDASALAVYIHSKAADIAVETTGYDALIASNIVNNIASALKLPVE